MTSINTTSHSLYMTLESNSNSPRSFRKFGDTSCSPRLLKRHLSKASHCRNRVLKEVAKMTLEAFDKDKAILRSGFHKGGLGYGKTGEHTDPRMHLTLKVEKGEYRPGGMYHLRFNNKGRLIQIRK